MVDLSGLWPPLIIAIIWTGIGIFALWFFRRGLKVPTESELEAEREQQEHANADQAADNQAAADHAGADQATPTAAH
ncbi:MAG TPA: hypothetical protein VGS80_17655 [Ktedonobacterales bacterium]|jgi:hypothetical protein|nr:hypothetical protein [Ktedonobacterales bacterium]